MIKIKTLNIEEGTWTRITVLRVQTMTPNMDDLVNKLLDIGEQKIRDESSVNNSALS